MAMLLVPFEALAYQLNKVLIYKLDLLDWSNVVGYWAEACILGGVVLFDRREPDSAPNVEVSLKAAYPAPWRNSGLTIDTARCNILPFR